MQELEALELDSSLLEPVLPSAPSRVPAMAMPSVPRGTPVLGAAAAAGGGGGGGGGGGAARSAEEAELEALQAEMGM
jgi:hypothetical protein